MTSAKINLLTRILKRMVHKSKKSNPVLSFPKFLPDILDRSHPRFYATRKAQAQKSVITSPVAINYPD